MLRIPNLRLLCLAVGAVFSLANAGCQTPYGAGCRGGCCGGSCGVGAPAAAAYAPAEPTYAAGPQGYPQQVMPPAFNGGGSGSR